MTEALEQILKFAPNANQTNETLDIYVSGLTHMYSGEMNLAPAHEQPQNNNQNQAPAPRLIIYDLPAVGGQVHLHEEDNKIIGRLYPYDRDDDCFLSLNAYESAMLDYVALKLALKRIEKEENKKDV